MPKKMLYIVAINLFLDLHILLMQHPNKLKVQIVAR